MIRSKLIICRLFFLCIVMGSSAAFAENRTVFSLTFNIGRSPTQRELAAMIQDLDARVYPYLCRNFQAGINVTVNTSIGGIKGTLNTYSFPWQYGFDYQAFYGASYGIRTQYNCPIAGAQDINPLFCFDYDGYPHCYYF
jgi:hypothetical protein